MWPYSGFCCNDLAGFCRSELNNLLLLFVVKQNWSWVQYSVFHLCDKYLCSSPSARSSDVVASLSHHAFALCRCPLTFLAYWWRARDVDGFYTPLPSLVPGLTVFSCTLSEFIAHNILPAVVFTKVVCPAELLLLKDFDWCLVYMTVLGLPKSYKSTCAVKGAKGSKSEDCTTICPRGARLLSSVCSQV